jgi:hypothetical protein
LLWDRSLEGDGNALKLLLERLPAQPLPAAPVVASPAAPPPSKGDKYEEVVALVKCLIQANILPIESFASFLPNTDDEPPLLPQ